ncbi:MAG: hypothetical protein GXO30_05640, partial [Epsilonproteobacteria bacterium]|nr:hypothetical protein [Campylobacterota bacterium]
MHQRNKVYTHLISALWNALAAAIMTVVVYQFFYIEFFRSNIEDYAFDLTNWFAISKKQEDLKTNNLFVLLVDDKYLKSQKLLDENNETTYGYILPRNYLVNIIKNIDALSKDIDEENHFENLFLDYDFSYLSDPHNKIPTQDDLAFLEILKKDRPYTIYLPITSNYNFIYHSKDKKIQKLIKSQKIKFVSVSLT